MRILKAAGLVAAIALAGCGGPTGMWSKDGASPGQSTLDQRGCLRESDSYGFLSGNLGPASILGSGGSRVASNRRNDLYRMCMNARGYVKSVEPDDE